MNKQYGVRGFRRQAVKKFPEASGEERRCKDREGGAISLINFHITLSFIFLTDVVGLEFLQFSWWKAIS